MRRIITVTLLAAIVAGIAWWMWQWGRGEHLPADPWGTVPADAAVVLEVPEPFAAWTRITGTSRFWSDLEGRPVFDRLDSVMVRLKRSDFAKQASGKEAPLVITWLPGKGPALVPLAAWPLAPSTGALQALGTAFGTAVPPELWSGVRIAIPADSALPALELGWAKGLLLIGTDATTVDRALQAGTGAPGPLFQQARESLSPGADAHLLIKPGLASQWLGARGQGIFPGDAPVEGWAALDVRVRPGAVLMNGLLFPEGGGKAVAAIRGQQPGMPAMLGVLPATARDLRVTQVSDPAAFVKAVGDKEADTVLFAAYAAWVKGSVGVAHGAGEEEAAWAVLGTDDPGAAAAALRARCPDDGCPEAEYRGVAMARTADPGALPALFGAAFNGFAQPLWAVLGDQVVLAETPAAMRAAIDAFTDRNALALDLRSADFFRRFASEAVYSWWAGPPAAATTGPAPLEQLRATFGDALLQLSPRPDGPLVATFCLQHEPAEQQQAGTLWSAALPAPVAMGPVLVKDYLSKTLQVFAQDRDDRVSLVSCTGKILWQRPVDGPIIGSVELIDRYRNGKLQFLFNTAGKVYLVDRLGRDVEGFPVALKTPACAPLSVFDYEGKGDLRIIVPLANGDVLNLGADGKPVKGWTSASKDGAAIARAEHVRIKGMDYIVVPRRSGHVSVLDRKGASRYTAKLRMGGIRTVLGATAAMDIGHRRIIWADSAGAVLSGTLDGRVDTLSAATAGEAILFRTGPESHIGVVRTSISAITGEAAGKLLFRSSFPDSPDAFAFELPGGPEGAAIGLVLPAQEQLRLYGVDGTLRPGFPLKGAVRFSIADIDLDGTRELVTADKQGVLTVLPLPAGN